MPFVRRTTKRRRFVRKAGPTAFARRAIGSSGFLRSSPTLSRTYNITAGRPKGPSTSLQQQITVQVSYTVPAWLTTSTVATTHSSAFFSQFQTDSGGSYLSVFDQYRIDVVECWLDTSAAAGTTVFGEIATAVDLDDATLPTIFNQVAHKQGSIVSNGGCGHYHRFVPHVAMAAYAAGAFTSFANVGPRWIDSASPNVQFYGLKASASATAAALIYNLHVRVTVSYRAPGLG